MRCRGEVRLYNNNNKIAYCPLEKNAQVIPMVVMYLHEHTKIIKSTLHTKTAFSLHLKY